MNRLKVLLRNELFLTCLLILVISALAYLPLIGKLDYYRDDWQVAWSGYTYGPAKIVQMFTIDRPFQGIVYAANYILLGNSPLNWQLYAFLQRIIGAFSVLWLARLLWPQQKTATAIMAALFAIYPGFLLMPNASMHQTLLFGLNLGLLSIATTVKGLFARDKILRYGLFGLSGLLAMGCVFMFEWMVGIEGLRLGVIWYILSRDSPSKFWPKVKATILQWLPGIIGVGIFFFWRLLIFKNTRSQTSVGEVVRGYFGDPLGSILRIPTELVKGFGEATAGAWTYPLYNLTSKLAFGSLFPIVLAGLTGAVIFFVVLHWITTRQGDTPSQQPALAADWTTPAMLIGAFSILVALGPVILVGRNPTLTGDSYDRYLMTSMAGVSMGLAGGLYKLVRSPRYQILLPALLIGLAVSTHIANANSYANTTAVRQQLWWQLSWRAPDLKNGTLIMPLMPPGTLFTDDFDIFPEVNFIYRPKVQQLQIAANVLNRDTARLVISGAQETRDMRTNMYSRDYTQFLLLAYGNGSDPQACVHVYDGNSPELTGFEDPIIPEVAPYSKIDQIDVSASPHQPQAVFFGSEPVHSWCYYYQKASLERQRGNWQEVARLGQEAVSLKFKPVDLSEWMPFLEGYANTNQLDLLKQTAALIQKDKEITFSLCRQFKPGAPVPPSFSSADAFSLIASNLCN